MSCQQFSLKIENPCTAAWDEMKPVGNNRHCLQCNKDVIDFSILSDAAIQKYFLEHDSKGVCGRFRTTQLENIRITLPSYFFYKKMPAWQKYLVVFLICFGSNLFSLEITVASQQGLYAQTTTAVTGKTKTKKKSKKKKKKIYEKMIRVESINIIMGMTITEPTYEPLQEREVERMLTKKETEIIKDSSAETTIGIYNEFPKKKKKARIFYFPKLEAVLPSRLKYPEKPSGTPNI